MRNKKRFLLKKYQLGTLGTSFGGFNSPTFETWNPSTSSPTYGNYAYSDPSIYSNASVIPEGSALRGEGLSSGKGLDGNIGSGIAGGLGAVAEGLGASAAVMRANTRSEIDPSNIYAYDPSKSGFQQHKRDAKITAQVLGAAGGVASSISNPVAQIIGAGLGVGAAGTEMGLADLEQRLIRAHDAKYKQRINVGGSQGDFTTQGQFTTMENPGRNITQAKMGGYLDKYRGGKINIDPAKKGTFKAQASRMNIGVQEAASKILNAPEGKYSPEMRKKANFAKNFAKETGGYLKQYMGGGMAVSNGVPRKYANAELEGGEVIEKQTGPDVYVKGPSHENGGVPMRLQEGGPAQGGDYVWSDHLTYKGKTMAELYAMAIENGASEEEIDQLRMLQEQLAGRAGEPQDAKEIEEMPTGKNGGILKRYQTGTPFSNLLPEATVYSDKKPKYITANEAFPQESIEDQNFKLKPEDVNHGSPKNNNSQEAYGKRTFGEKMSDYAPEILAGASTVAPIIAAATVKNPYKDLKVPKGERVSVEKQFFERTDSRAEEAANQRGASLSKQLLQQAGFGPGEIAAMQKVELDRQAADAGARQRAREFNISQDRAEKQMNTELELRADMANQEMANKFAELEYNRQFGEAGFEAQRGTTLADYISGATRDAAAYAGDYRKMKAIYGETGIGERSRGYDAGKARKAIEKQNPYDSSKYNSVQDWNKYIDQLVREDSKRYNESKNKK